MNIDNPLDYRKTPNNQLMKTMDKYNLIWNAPSRGHNGSMPLGNGDIGLNAWVEKNGDIVFFISKTDSWDDNGRLLKVGKVRIKLAPPPFGASHEFIQTLNLMDGTINIQYGKGAAAIVLRLWVDAHHPAVHVEIDSQRKVKAEAAIELWRTGQSTLPSIECSDVMNPSSDTPDHKPPEAALVVEPDTVLTGLTGRIGWRHRNIKSIGPELLARIQGVQDFKRPDPLLHRTFGAVITAPNGRRIDDLHLQSPSSTSHRFSIYIATEHPATPRQWLQAVDRKIAAGERIPLEKRREAHRRWWREFWSRSWIHVTSGAATKTKHEAFVVSRAYALQRFVNACAGRGRYPIKFNGSIFTVPYRGKPGGADYRQWGPGYWWQNTRLPYAGMCASGDFDLMQPLFRMYGKDLMPLFKHRTLRHVGHDGAYIPECVYFWGDIIATAYGWTPFEQRTDKLQASPWHKWEWVAGLELVFVMLDYYEHTLDRTFLRKMLLPTAHEILVFFDRQYQTGKDGKLVIHPAQALETWWNCTNPMCITAGLHAVTGRLLSLEKGLTTAKQRIFWNAFKRKLPDLPTRKINGRTLLAPATKFSNKMNSENPELYAVFPFRLIAVGKPGMELGMEALKCRLDKGNSGWRQDDILMAYLGLADQAREYLVGRARNKHRGSRFPAFWGPNYDWIPDQDHGSVLIKTLQAMLLQTDGRKIRLLPAWPENWDADFKLHAPYKTTIVGKVKNGKLAQMNIFPESRRKDVIVDLPRRKKRFSANLPATPP